MIVDFKDIVFGFDYVSAGQMGENQAYLNKKNRENNLPYRSMG